MSKEQQKCLDTLIYSVNDIIRSSLDRLEYNRTHRYVYISYLVGLAFTWIISMRILALLGSVDTVRRPFCVSIVNEEGRDAWMSLNKVENVDKMAKLGRVS